MSVTSSSRSGVKVFQNPRTRELGYVQNSQMQLLKESESELKVRGHICETHWHWLLLVLCDSHIQSWIRHGSGDDDTGPIM